MKTSRLLAAGLAAAACLATAQVPTSSTPSATSTGTPTAVVKPAQLVPVPAQLAQSPASAHGFFLAVAQSQVVTVSDGAADPLQPTRVTLVESAGCLTRIVTAPPGPAGLTINWSAVRSVKAEHERHLRLLGPGVNWVLGFETRDMADRAGRALSTVRRSCDPIEGFGF